MQAFDSQSYVSLFKIDTSLECKYLIKQIENSLIYYDVKIGANKFQALLDCGATRTWMDIGTAQKDGFRLTEIEPIEVELADSSKAICKHKIDRVDLKFKSFRHDTDLYVMDFKGAHDIILGRDFLYRRNPIIDWRTGEMSLRRNSSKLSAGGGKCLSIPSVGRLAKNLHE